MGDRPTQHPNLETQEEIKESLEIALRRRGDPLDGFVRYRDLTDSQLADIGFEGDQVVIRPGRSVGGGGVPGASPGAPDFGRNDTTRPPAPTGVRARGVNLSSIGVTWNPAPYNNHAYAEVFASFENSWTAVAATFDANRPVGPGNSSQHFMGRASGTMFLHRNLSSTVPTLSLERPIESMSHAGGQYTVTLDGDQSDFTSPGDEAYFAVDGDWNANGLQGDVISVNYTASTGVTAVVVEAPAGISLPAPEGARLVVIRDQDALEQALNPQTVYYWVRFVSTASVAGNPQGEDGAAGTVMLNPEEILNVLTGRIRASQLASDVVSPINFVRGPITELDEEGNRKFPTVRDFVNSLGGDLISEYDETLEEVFLGYLGGGDWQSAQIVGGFALPAFDAIAIYVPEEQPWIGIGTRIALSAPAGSLLSPLSASAGEPKIELTVIDFGPSVFFDGSFSYVVQAPDGVTIPDTDEEVPAQGTIYPFETEGESPGLTAAAAFVARLAGQTSADGAWIESLETLQAAIQQDGGGDPLNLEGIHQIIGTISQKAMVNLGLEEAAIEIRDNLQFEIEGEDGETELVAANEAANVIFANESAISQSITFKAQQNVGGVLFSAGFGIGLESEPGEEPTSTFVVAADQFAIMSAASHGRVIKQVQSAYPDWIVTVVNTESGAIEDGLAEGEHVAFMVPFDSPLAPFRGKRFRVVSRPLWTPAGQFNIRVEHVPLNEDDTRPTWTGTTADLPPTHALFPEQSVPFIVDTDKGVVAIRGSLIVDGMITATEIEVTDLLRANEIWSQGITAFGLINTSSLIGETIATPRFGGWAVKMTSPDTSYQNRVFEFSRWQFSQDALPDSDNPDDWLNQESQYPQLRGDEPADTAFFVDAQGRGFIRGSLQVGGNARIMTYNDETGQNSDWFVQMDQEFPLMVFPFSETGGLNMSNAWDGWSYNDIVRNRVRSEALFWVHRGGTAGFNTEYESIFMGETPMEPPAGGGSIRVITRLENGQPTGTGRVYVSASFEVRSNRWQPSDRIGIWYDLFVVPADQDLGGMSITFPITARESEIARPDGATHPYQVFNPDYMDTHFLIVRSQSSSQTGWQARQQFMNAKGLHSRWVRGFYSAAAGPRTEHIDGIAGINTSLEASPNYRAVVVATEITAAIGGTDLFGPLVNNDNGNMPGSAIIMLNGLVTSQQISERRLLTPAAKNSYSDGSGGGTVDPNEEQIDPGQPPHLVLGDELDPTLQQPRQAVSAIVDGGEDL